MSEAVKSLQMGLLGLGFNPGLVDGVEGPRTLAAAAAYVKARSAQSKPVQPVTSAMIYQGSKRYPVREIIVHCTATRPDFMPGASTADRVAEVRRWHKANGWNDIGYHWLIDRDGTVASGRAETVIGAHVVGRNAGTIGISLFGGHGSSETDRFAENFTAAQERELRHLIASISLRTQITTISGHNQHAAKACPGFNVPLWFKGA